uniref:Uncharacterized protein n=1 Tax=Anopheles atroparvus TaxID=41427 RepID=A0A182ISG0_ANOAO
MSEYLDSSREIVLPPVPPSAPPVPPADALPGTTSGVLSLSSVVLSRCKTTKEIGWTRGVPMQSFTQGIFHFPRHCSAEVATACEEEEEAREEEEDDPVAARVADASEEEVAVELAAICRYHRSPFGRTHRTDFTPAYPAMDQATGKMQQQQLTN